MCLCDYILYSHVPAGVLTYSNNSWSRLVAILENRELLEHQLFIVVVNFDLLPRVHVCRNHSYCCRRDFKFRKGRVNTKYSEFFNLFEMQKKQFRNILEP